jgi:hypothetical protein
MFLGIAEEKEKRENEKSRRKKHKAAAGKQVSKRSY